MMTVLTSTDCRWMMLSRETSVQLLIRTLTTWHCPHSPAARRAAVRRAAIDRYVVPAGSTLHSSQVCCREPCWDRRTDGQTDARQMHRPRSAYYGERQCKTCEFHMAAVTVTPPPQGGGILEQRDPSVCLFHGAAA